MIYDMKEGVVNGKCKGRVAMGCRWVVGGLSVGYRWVVGCRWVGGEMAVRWLWVGGKWGGNSSASTSTSTRS